MSKRFSIHQSQLVADLQLLAVVCISIAAAGLNALVQSEGTLRERVWAAVLIALAPACIAWPTLFRRHRLIPIRVASRRRS